MSNYNKSFNFRNGVQVDDSNFIVNAAGLVGIGTTVPAKRLDVRGNAQISGGLNLNNVNVTGIVTVGAGITLDSTSGIITATKFVGDASGLTNIVAISTIGFIANAGTLSTTAKIGIGTTTPSNQLDVLGDTEFEGDVNVTGLLTSAQGIHVNANGIDAVGIITSTSLVIDDYIYHAGDLNTFIGFETNDRITFTTNGSDKLSINASGHLILLDDDDTYIFHSDNNTLAVVTSGDERLSISGAGITVTGEVSATGAIRGTSFSGHSGVPADFSNGLIAAASTFTNDVKFEGSSQNITFDKSANALKFDDGAVEFFGTNDNLEISHSGGISLIRDTRAGVGTLAIGANKLFLRNKDGNENYLEATDNGSVKLFYDFTPKFETIAIGASVFGQLQVAQLNGGTGGLSTYYGALRYGNTENASPYSTETSLDLINYDVGNINFYLDAENRSTTPGNFHWWRGFSGASGKLMTLTGIGGSLGIGITEPKDNLHVGGGVTVDGSLYVNSNVTVGGDLSVDTFVGNLTGTAVTATKFVGLLNGNVNIDSGISTFRRVEFPSSVSKVGIATTSPLENSDDVIHINTYSGSGPLNKVIINNQGQIGVKTDLIISNSEVGVDCRDFAGLFKFLVVGRDPEFSANQPAIDFRSAGTVTGVTTNRSMVLPTVNTTSRNKLPTIAGSIIYNSSNNRAELYNGTDWVGIVTEA